MQYSMVQHSTVQYSIVDKIGTMYSIICRLAIILGSLTFIPLFMVAPNHTGFGVLERELHQLFRGMLGGFADTHVSPVSMLQYTLIASFRLPSLGSTQYSPITHSEMRVRINSPVLSSATVCSKLRRHNIILQQHHIFYVN